MCWNVLVRGSGGIMKKENKGLYYLVFRAMAIVASVIIISLNLHMYYTSIRDFRSEMDNKATDDIEAIDHAIATLHDTNNNILEVFTRNPIVTKIHTEAFNEKDLFDLQKVYNDTYDYVSSIYLGTATGKMYSARGDELPSDYDPRTRPWYKESFTSFEHSTITAIYKDIGEEHTDIITYVKNIYRGMEKVAVVGIDIDLKVFQESLDKMVMRRKSSILILNASNEIIGASSFEAQLNEAFKKSLYRKFDMTEEDSSKLIYNNVTYYVYAKENDELNWTVVELVPRSLILTKIYKTMRITIIMTLLAVMLVLVFTIKTRKILMKPIDIIVENINGIKEGDYNNFQELNENEYSEFVKIQDEIKLMSQQISIQYDEINALYEETVAMNESQEELLKELHENYGQTIASLSNAMEANDIYTKGHCSRVSELSLIIGDEIGLSNSDMRVLEYAAQLHDIGKVGVPNQIINKEGPLDDGEYDWIKKHPVIGYKILKDIQFLSKEAAIVLEHHERYDGSGYPNGTAGEDIPLLSRIISIADSYDAMTSSRSYRKKPLSFQEANLELIKGKTSQFDPDLVEAFLSANVNVSQDEVDFLFEII